MKGVYLFERLETPDCPAGITVSRKPKLPEGDFEIAPFSWPDLVLGFVVEDAFTADERQQIYEALKRSMRRPCQPRPCKGPRT